MTASRTVFIAVEESSISAGFQSQNGTEWVELEYV